MEEESRIVELTMIDDIEYVTTYKYEGEGAKVTLPLEEYIDNIVYNYKQLVYEYSRGLLILEVSYSHRYAKLNYVSPAIIYLKIPLNDGFKLLKLGEFKVNYLGINNGGIVNEHYLGTHKFKLEYGEAYNLTQHIYIAQIIRGVLSEMVDKYSVTEALKAQILNE